MHSVIRAISAFMMLKTENQCIMVTALFKITKYDFFEGCSEDRSGQDKFKIHPKTLRRMS